MRTGFKRRSCGIRASPPQLSGEAPGAGGRPLRHVLGRAAAACSPATTPGASWPPPGKVRGEGRDPRGWGAGGAWDPHGDVRPPPPPPPPGAPQQPGLGLGQVCEAPAGSPFQINHSLKKKSKQRGFLSNASVSCDTTDSCCFFTRWLLMTNRSV